MRRARGDAAANRVVSSSARETLAYDAVGNTLEQRVRDDEGNLLRSVTTCDAENRAAVTVSTDKDGRDTTSTNRYDAECRGSMSACADLDGTKGLSSAKARPAGRGQHPQHLHRRRRLRLR